MWPDVPPAQPYDKSIQELTGERPYRGTLMYYHQFGIQDPYEAPEAPEPSNQGPRASDVIHYLEQSHYEHQNARHRPSHTLLGQRIQAQISKESRTQSPRRSIKERHTKPPQQSRELIGPPRPGRATELFQQGRVRADHHVVDESNVCPSLPRSLFKALPRFALKKSPWSAAAESYSGDPRDAFETLATPTKERLPRQQPLRAKIKAPKERVVPGAIEMDYARPPHGGHFNPRQQQPQKQFKPSSSWKSGPNVPHTGASYKRFHSNVIPYETDFNRKATGWAGGYVPEAPTDPIFPQGGGGGGGGGGQQYSDFNPRPQAWQGQDDEDAYVPYDQKKAIFQQDDQQQYYQQQQQQQQQQAQYHQPQQQYHQPQQQQYHQPQQQQYHQTQPQRGRAQLHQPKAVPRPKPKPGRGSAAPRQNYAGPQQQSWGGGLVESDDL